MNITKEELRKTLSDGFDENMTDVDNWNEAVFYNNKDKFIEDVVDNLSQHIVSCSSSCEDISKEQAVKILQLINKLLPNRTKEQDLTDDEIDAVVALTNKHT